MNFPINPLMFIGATVIGAFSAYLAYTRGRNPYLWFAIGFLFGLFGVFAIFFATRTKKETPPKEKPEYTIAGPTDKFWYFLDPAHQKQGPMSHEALVVAWKKGTVNISTYVWNEDMVDWRPLKESLKTECGTVH